MIAVGERGKTITTVDRRPQYWVPPDKTGTVIRAEQDCIVVQMDEPIEGCEQNQVVFTPDNYGMYWWQTNLDTVEMVYRYHFVLVVERTDMVKNSE